MLYLKWVSGEFHLIKFCNCNLNYLLKLYISHLLIAYIWISKYDQYVITFYQHLYTGIKKKVSSIECVVNTPRVNAAGRAK